MSRSHDRGRTLQWTLAFIAILGTVNVDAQTATVTLKRSELGNEGLELQLSIPKVYFEQWGSANDDALNGRHVPYVILRTLYPSFSPQPGASQRGVPRADGIRVIIEPIGRRDAGRADSGAFRLGLNLQGAHRLIAQGEPFGPQRVQRYLTADGKTEGYAFKSEDGFTVFASCALSLMFCRAWRTWKSDYRVDYLFGVGFRGELPYVDSGVIRLLDTFNPTAKMSRK